jgi:hypothetical protein
MGAQTYINLAEQVSGMLGAANGGTGRATLTAHYTIVGNGTSAVSMVAPGTATYCYISNGAAADPSFQACPGPPNFADAETPTGLVNSTNQSYTLAHTPNPAASLRLFLNGQRLVSTGDFTLVTATITTVGTPQTGDVLVADYRY